MFIHTFIQQQCYTHLIVPRFEGAPDDPLLRAEIAKREQAQQSRQNEAEAAQSSEHQVERGSTGHNEGDDEAKEAGSRNRNESTDDPSRNPHDSNAESHEKSLAQQVLGILQTARLSVHLPSIRQKSRGEISPTELSVSRALIFSRALQ